MANEKSNQSAPPSTVQNSPQMVSVPVLSIPRRKAPATDPHLREGTVTSQKINFHGVELPPLIDGIQPGLDLDGKPVDYSVRIMWANRQDIDLVLRAVERETPELELPLQLVRRFMCQLDSIRDNAIFGLTGLAAHIQSGDIAGALEAIAKVREGLGNWHDAQRLSLR